MNRKVPFLICFVFFYVSVCVFFFVCPGECVQAMALGCEEDMVWVNSLCACVHASELANETFALVSIRRQICSVRTAATSVADLMQYQLCDAIIGSLVLDGPAFSGNLPAFHFLRQLQGSLTVTRTNLTSIDLAHLHSVHGTCTQESIDSANCTLSIAGKKTKQTNKETNKQTNKL